MGRTRSVTSRGVRAWICAGCCACASPQAEPSPVSRHGAATRSVAQRGSTLGAVAGRRVVRTLGFGLALSLLIAPAAGAERARAGKSADQSLANTSLIQLNDLPPGWLQGSRTGSLPFSKVGAPCRRQTALERSATARGQSPDFSQNSTNESVSGSDAVFPTAARAAALASSLESSSGQACLSAQTQDAVGLASLQSGASISVQTIGRLSVAPLGADQEFGYEVVLQVSKSGLSAKAYVDETVWRVGRVDVSFGQTSTLTAPSGDLVSSYESAVQRSQQAQGLSSAVPSS